MSSRSSCTKLDTTGLVHRRNARALSSHLESGILDTALQREHDLFAFHRVPSVIYIYMQLNLTPQHV